MDSPQKNQPESVVLANCLSCRGIVRVPAKAPTASKVRCPHCEGSYFLYEILDQSIPELEIVDDSQPEAMPRVDQVIQTDEAKVEREAFVVPPQLSKGAIRPKRSRSGSSSSDSGESRRESYKDRESGRENDYNGSGRRSSSSKSKSSSRGSSSRGSSSSSRSRKPPERSSALEMLKVVVGGMLAIPIAYFMVFWILRQDPLNVAPSLNKMAPFLVPRDFRDDIPPLIQPDPAASSDSDEGTDDESMAIPDLDPEKVLKDVGG